jgi:hypothetical protein
MKSTGYCFKHPLDVNIHTDPIRTRPPVAINATTDVIALDANILRVRAAVTPPFGWPKQSNNRRARSNRDVRGAGIAADVNPRAFRE